MTRLCPKTSYSSLKISYQLDLLNKWYKLHSGTWVKLCFWKDESSQNQLSQESCSDMMGVGDMTWRKLGSWWRPHRITTASMLDTTHSHYNKSSPIPTSLCWKPVSGQKNLLTGHVTYYQNSRRMPQTFPQNITISLPPFYKILWKQF